MPTLFKTFEKAAREHSGRVAIGFLEKGNIVEWTYRDLLEKVELCARSLRQLGISKDNPIAMISANHHLWPIVDIALAKLGAVFVPIHTTLTVEQMAKILRQSKAKGLVVGPGVEDKIDEVLSKLNPEIDWVLFLDDALKASHPVPGKPAHSFAERMSLRDLPSSNGIPEIADHDISTIIFTSGTTGEMKGVLLTHGGLVDSVLYGNPLVNASKDEIIVSVLPLSHAFERNSGLYGPLFCGGRVYYGRGLAQLIEDIQTFRPTRISAVPRLLEKIESGIKEGLQKKSAFLHRNFLKLLEKSVQFHRLKSQNDSRAKRFSLADRLGELIFYRKIRKKFGGRLQGIICGGAPIDAQVVEFFQAIGIQVLQGYGLTEVSPTVSVNPYYRNKIGSVGIPLKCVQVKLGENDEVLVKGSSLMKGYDNEQATREAIDSEGWFHTGDQGYLDAEGYLYIKGRIKELIVTSYGKNIVPSLVEQALEKSPLILQSAVFGHGKAYLVALLVLNRENLLRELTDPELRALPWEELCRHPKVEQKIKESLPALQKELASYEQIKKFQIIPEEFSQANDLLTPTLKLKRIKLLERYGTIVKSMYE